MKRFVSISLWAFALLVGICFAACSSHDDDVDTCEEEGLYIRLELGLSLSTRAVSDHPWGGEDGDGRENGNHFENDIHNLCLFIYDGADGKGVNGNPETPIKFKKYFDDLHLSLSAGEYRSTPLKISGYAAGAYDRIVMIANRGDVTGDFTTLGDFQRTNYSWEKSSLWTDNANPSLCNDFVMTSSNEEGDYGKMDVYSRSGAYYDPFCARVELSRVMARVDIWWNDANKATELNGPMSFETTDGTGTLKLSHIRMINTSNGGTFPLKRVANAATQLTGGNVGTLIGKESVVTSTHIPNNYVHTQLTYQKTGSLASLTTWYDNTTTLEASKALNAEKHPTFLTDDACRVHAFASDSRVFSAKEDINGDGITENCYTVGYCTENTMPKEYQKHQYMTGLAVKGTFLPKKVYSWNAGALVEVADYTAALTAGTAMAWLQTHDIWHYVDKEDADPLKSYYFSSEEAVRAYEKSRPAVAHSIDHYFHGECYYYIWIRHASPDASHASGTFPMEYAIVRNNIYRIGIERVQTIGTPVPDDAPEEKVYSKIYVRQWRVRQEPEIVM